MDPNHHNYRSSSSIIPERDQDLPLDQVLKPRHYGKKLPSSDSESKLSLNVPKVKPISKEKNQQSPKPTQVSSTDLVRQLIFDQSLKLNEMEELMIRLKNIKSLKYEKLTEKVRQVLVETVFSYNYPRFVSIMRAFNPKTLSSHLITAIFQGYVQAWKTQNFNSIDTYLNFFKLYCQQIPNCINKPYIKWLSQKAKQNEAIYPSFRGKVLEHVKQVIKNSNRQKSNENEKIIALIVYFELMGALDQKQLMKIVPLEKIGKYTDNDYLPQSNYLNNNNSISPLHQKQKDQSQKSSEVKSNDLSPMMSDQTINVPTIPPFINSSILQLIRQNNLKQTEKLIRTYKIPYTHYPEFVQKLELKYLEYIERTYPIYFVDQLIYNKISLVQNLVQMYIKRKKFDYVEHFINKYMLRGVKEPILERILPSPLVDNDCFGPTESHVMHQYAMNYFSQLQDFGITSKDVIWIDSKTIHNKKQAKYLINLLYLDEVGIDSQSTSGIHVFEKAKLEIIQLYDPKNNVVLLFDVRDFKNEKKKRTRKSQSSNGGSEKIFCQQKQEEKKNPNYNIKEKTQNNTSKEIKGKSINQPINLQEDQDQNQSIKKQEQKSAQKSQNSTTNNKISDTSPQKAWYKFTKVFQNLLKRTIIFGHCLHTDLGDIIKELDLQTNLKSIKFTDSQQEFKKYFPNENKSKLGYLTEKCFGKELSKYEQCSAWDNRPLREAQRHYAALDAVLPYKLVKWMEENNEKK